MTFDNLLNDTNCDCISNAVNDTDSAFGLVTKNDTLRETYFRTKWEKGQRPDNLTDCKKVCSKKGLSISLFDNDTMDKVISVFSQLFASAPGYKGFISVIKLDIESGVVKSTPSKINPHHFDFYKSDQFDLDKVKCIQSISLRNHV